MANGIEKIVQRLGGKTEQSLITETYSFLERSKRESGMAEEEFVSKEDEAKGLIHFADQKNIWFEDTQFATYLVEGAEQDQISNKI
jgi:hypothetical protein